jgi:RimJ/RimL family protein N-acetyltransferase
VTSVADDVVARGERVLLRKKRLSDAAVDYSWRRDPELASFDAAKPIRATFREFLAGYSEELKYPAPYRQTLAIEDLDGHHIGNIMVYNLDQQTGEGELGITVGDRNYWGGGRGTDAVRTFVRYLFTELQLNRVILHTLEWNLRAQRSFTRAGFVPLGLVKRGDHTFVQMEVRQATWTGEPARAE